MTIKEFKIQYALGIFSDEDLSNIAEDLKTQKPILSLLSKNPNWSVRVCVASNENTPKYILNRLSKDPLMNVRYFVAHNSSTPKATLKRLKNDAYPSIRTRAIKVLARITEREIAKQKKKLLPEINYKKV